MVIRKIFETFALRLREPRRFIQVISGPRQTGKTTLVQYVLGLSERAAHYASADAVLSAGAIWLEQQWEIARQSARKGGETVLAIDEIQKIPNWSETVKILWDEDTAHARYIKVVLLGSAQLLVQKGLTESLAGRFEVLHATHWSYPEMRDGFGFSLELLCGLFSVGERHFLENGDADGLAPQFRRPEPFRAGHAAPADHGAGRLDGQVQQQKST